MPISTVLPRHTLADTLSTRAGGSSIDVRGGAPDAPLGLTIETGHLADLFLPAARQELEAVEYLDKAMRRSYGKRTYEPLLSAFCIVRKEYFKTIETVRTRGGLLHLVFA